MRDHPNIKHILKNRRLLNQAYPIIIKNDQGEYWCGDYAKWQKSNNMTYYSTLKLRGDFQSNEHVYYPFLIAQKQSGRVYLETSAGDIELFEKQFQ